MTLYTYICNKLPEKNSMVLELWTRPGFLTDGLMDEQTDSYWKIEKKNLSLLGCRVEVWVGERGRGQVETLQYHTFNHYLGKLEGVQMCSSIDTYLQKSIIPANVLVSSHRRNMHYVVKKTPVRRNWSVSPHKNIKLMSEFKIKKTPRFPVPDV